MITCSLGDVSNVRFKQLVRKILLPRMETGAHGGPAVEELIDYYGVHSASKTQARALATVVLLSEIEREVVRARIAADDKRRRNVR